jgi:hypothetical protein
MDWRLPRWLPTRWIYRIVARAYGLPDKLSDPCQRHEAGMETSVPVDLLRNGQITLPG